MVEIVTAKVCVAIGGFYFKYAIAKFEYGYIECAASEVEYSDFLVLVGLVEALCQCCGCRFVHDTAYGEACYFSCFFCGLAL